MVKSSRLGGWRVWGVAALALIVAFIAVAGLNSARPAQAAAGQVLILDSTVSGGAGSTLAGKFTLAGKTPVVVNAATWGGMTTAQFASYDAIVLGDPTCRTGTSTIAAAMANTAVWGPAVDGNVIVIGTDETFHQSQGGALLMEKAAAFVVADSAKTGAYVSLSCYYHGTAAGTPVPVLNAFGGGFTATGVPGCFNSAHIVASHPALSGLTDGTLSGWGCSVHEAFDAWPVDFEVLAIATTGSVYTAPDGSVGTPYILARGVQVISDIDLAPQTATNYLGETHTVTATVTTDDPAPGAPVVGTTVTFTVIAGPHTGTTGTGVTNASGVATFSYVGTSLGVDTIEATFVDSLGRAQRSNRVSKEWIEIVNLPPTADAGDPYSVPEGSSVTVDASGSSDPDGDTLTYNWDLDNDGFYDDASGATASFAGVEGPASHIIGVEACDPDLACDTASSTVDVVNVAPALSGLAVTTPIDEDDTATVTGTITDLGVLDPFTVDIDWGAGEAPSSLSLPAGTASFSATHQYLDDNPTGTPADGYSVSVSVADDDGGADTSSSGLTVNNLAPTATVSGPASVDEGGSGVYSVSYSDVGTLDTHTVAWDCDGDGFDDGSGASVTCSAFPDGPATVTVQAEVTDDDTGAVIASLDVTVNNVAPVVDAGADGGAPEGSVFARSSCPALGAAYNPDNGHYYAAIPAAGGITYEDAKAAAAASNCGGSAGHLVTITSASENAFIAANLPSAVNPSIGFTPPFGYWTGAELSGSSWTWITGEAFSYFNWNTGEPNGFSFEDRIHFWNSTGGRWNDAASTHLFPGYVVEYEPVTGAFTDPGADTWTATVDYGDDAGPDPLALDGASFSLSHAYGHYGDYTVTVEVCDDDLGCDSNTLVVHVTNVAPTLSALAADPQPVDEGSPATVSGTFTDPSWLDTHTVSADCGGGDLDSQSLTEENAAPDSTGSVEVVCVYGHAGTYTVTVTVTDDAGDSDTQTIDVAVSNVAPALSAITATPAAIDEAGSVTFTASFTDPSWLDTHSATIDCGFPGLVEDSLSLTEENASPDSSGDIEAVCSYGDNGDYTVTITVTDDLGDSHSQSVTVTVSNVDPTLTLNHSGSISFVGGEAFIGRKGVAQTHDASAGDVGSDDLTFDWSFAPDPYTESATYYNDGIGPDGLPSPLGTYPFGASDAATVTFGAAGVYTVGVAATGDDGGLAADSLPKLVTGDASCARSQGYWKRQFSDKGNQHIDDATLTAYLSLTNWASAVFSEQVAATTLPDAQAVFQASQGPSKRAKANAQALAAWLNWANGGADWAELIDTNDDHVGDTPFTNVMAQIEAILLNPAATNADLDHAKDLAEAVNLSDEHSAACGDDDGEDDEDEGHGSGYGDDDDDHDNGHGNDGDHDDDSNPGNGNGGHGNDKNTGNTPAKGKK